MNADLLKIDGSFIRNLVTSSLDYQAVASICLLARMKNMQVVAEYVETPRFGRLWFRWGLIICRAMISANRPRLRRWLRIDKRMGRTSGPYARN
jgi:predicted signal transduction protein with EAL and GGDEF domain